MQKSSRRYQHTRFNGTSNGRARRSSGSLPGVQEGSPHAVRVTPTSTVKVKSHLATYWTLGVSQPYTSGPTRCLSAETATSGHWAALCEGRRHGFLCVTHRPVVFFLVMTASVSLSCRGDAASKIELGNILCASSF